VCDLGALDEVKGATPLPCRGPEPLR